MRELRCRKVRLLLPAHVFGGRPLTRRDEDHLSRCLVCQAEVAGYRRLQAALRSMRDEAAEAPPWFVERVLTAMQSPERRQQKGIVVAVLVLIASAAVAVWGRRRLKPVS
jgi:hypothetical protein